MAHYGQTDLAQGACDEGKPVNSPHRPREAQESHEVLMERLNSIELDLPASGEPGVEREHDDWADYESALESVYGPDNDEPDDGDFGGDIGCYDE
jgi:hypothetical protein